MQQNFDRPVFIMAAPRSCSSLLFQTLAQSDTLWSLGDESHQIFERHPNLSPGRGPVDSNRLTADNLNGRMAQAIPAAFIAQVKDRDGNRPRPEMQQKIRLLEKTPKHALRIPFINALFPDAVFIYLFRDPRQNISSIIDAWQTGRFVTYPRFTTAHGPWSLLLPPGWRDVIDQPLEEIAAFQWLSANRYIIEDLGRLEPRRWTAINAEELIKDPLAAVTRLCGFMDIAMDSGLRAYLERPLPPSRYTVSIPEADKWRKNASLLARVWPRVVDLIPAINRFVDGKAQALAATLPDDGFATDTTPGQPPQPRDANAGANPSRNQPCPCGSGKRYKACHGQMSQ